MCLQFLGDQSSAISDLLAIGWTSGMSAVVLNTVDIELRKFSKQSSQNQFCFEDAFYMIVRRRGGGYCSLWSRLWHQQKAPPQCCESSYSSVATDGDRMRRLCSMVDRFLLPSPPYPPLLSSLSPQALPGGEASVIPGCDA